VSDKKRSLFITFEGGEGSGKTTQLALLRNRLERAGFPLFATREPGGTPLSEEIRKLLVTGQPERMGPTTELLLMVAARSDHVRRIRTALEQCETVLCDRFSDSSVVYQGAGRGLDAAWIRQLNTWATGGLEPDLTFLLDIDPERGLYRAGKVECTEKRFEQERMGFHRAIRAGFLELARQEAGRFRVLDASRSVDYLSDAIWKEVQIALAELTSENFQ